MWKKIHDKRWERDDNAVVKYDHTTECNTSRPWLKGHRGYIAYGPGEEEHNYLGHRRKDSRFYIPRKFKTPEAAMKVVDKEYPEGRS